MKLVFAGTPDFARHALAALVAAGHEIVLVMAQPDRPSGRGLRVQPGPVKALALELGVPVLQPRGLRIGGKYDADAREAHERLRSVPHDAMIVAAYGLILPQSVLDIAPLGCINIHASLLPRWRGAAPVQRAIEAGDATTGVTIMQMDAGLDTGAMLLVKSLAIRPDDSGGSLTERLAVLGGEAIVEALPLIGAGRLAPLAQPAPDDPAVTYAHKLTKDEGLLDFASASRVLVDRIRAFNPWPGCTALVTVDGQEPFVAKIWRAAEVHAESKGERPGDAWLTRDAIHVRTGDGVVAITELQKPGAKRLPASAFANDWTHASVLRFTRPEPSPPR